MKNSERVLNCKLLLFFLIGFCSMEAYSQAFQNVIGINASSPKDYEPKWTFADAMMQSRTWGPISGTTPVKVDSNGWPLSDGKIIIGHQSDYHGTYRITFNGKATVDITGGSVTSQSYDAATNKTTALANVTEQSEFYMYLLLTGIGSQYPVSNIKVMRPVEPGSATPHDESEIGDRKFIELLKKFNFLRAMDLLGTNSDLYHTQVDWASRTKPADASQARSWVRIENNEYVLKNEEGKNYFAYQSKGVSWERLIQLANEANIDLWICVPHAVNDEYITKLAKLIKYGSDGAEPYDSPQGENAVFKPLKSNLKLYIEYSNETWNSGFPVYKYIDAKVAAEGTSGNPNLQYDGSTNANYLRARFTARRTIEISTIFRSVFGNEAMGSKIRPLYEWQKGKNDADRGNTNRNGTSGLMFIENNYPNPVNYYIWGAGPSGYFQADSPVEGATAENLWDRGEFVPANWLYKQVWAVSITSAYGLYRMIYEGGPSFGDQNGTSGINPLGANALNDIRIKNEIVENHDIWSNVGGYGYGYFVLSADERWGFMQTPTHYNSYKLQAIDALKESQRKPITYFTQVLSNGESTFVNGNQWYCTNIDNGGYQWDNENQNDNSKEINTGVWINYPFHVATSAKYKMRVYYKTTGNATLACFFGSDQIGSQELTASEGNVLQSNWFSGNLSAEMVMGARVKAISGSIEVVKIEIAYESPTGIVSNTKSEKITVYPNPCTEMITVHPAENYCLEIYNLNGQLLKCMSNTSRINTADLKEGMYFLKITGKNSDSVVKFIKD